MEKDQKAKVQEQFSRSAEEYVTSKTHAKGNDLPVIVEWLQPSQQWSVLDIATGGGHVVKTLSPYVKQIIATDLTPQMLITAQKHLDTSCKNVTYVVADAESLPFLNETFDAVTCRIAAHHFPNPQDFVSEVSRVLKLGNRFLLIDNISSVDIKLDVFINTLEKLRDDSHLRCYSIDEWTAWFEEHGLTIIKSEKRRKKLEFPVWVRRTTQSEEQVKAVIDFILGADQEKLDYFSVVMKDGEIESIEIDEWMVMVEKNTK
ncbi:type 11 methyltransferase [Mycobacteroides abscessus subsp. abscessus]|nr:type 11 methyltransferase [Mycobacteroides abscessus subsp. abscessus]